MKLNCHDAEILQYAFGSAQHHYLLLFVITYPFIFKTTTITTTSVFSTSKISGVTPN